MTDFRSGKMRAVSTSDLTDPDSFFRRTYLARPCGPTDEDRRARELALEYHTATERYDRAVCSSRDAHGNGVPTGPGEVGKINRYAQEILKQVRQDAEKEGVSWSKVQAAIRVVGREIDRGCTSV